MNLIRENKDTILVVDDQPNNLKVIASVLNQEYKLLVANSGYNALAVLDAEMPDLILLDVMMPEMNGFEVCERIKNVEILRDIPIIFLTAKADIEDIQKGFEVGAVDYITKPFNLAELKTRVSSHLKLYNTQRQLKELNEKLVKSEKELNLANETKNKFFRIIAHDLKSPFSGFLGLTDMLANNLDKMKPEMVESLSKSMSQESKRLYNLLDNLLEWSYSQMGLIKFEPIQIDLYDVSVRTLSLFESQIESKNLKIKNSLEKNSFVFADNHMLNSIFKNIISNAIKYSKLNGSINISSILNNDNHTYTVIIEDRGIGISQDFLSTIFNIDSKHITVGTDNEKGTGIGLVLCKEFIEKNGGRIFADSEIGVGTTIYFTLPEYKI